jgi:hypothetical protein
LQHGGNALQGVVFHAQGLRGLAAGGRILGAQRDRLGHRQRAGCAQRIVRGREDFRHGSELLLHAQQAALLRAHGGLALFVKGLGADAHHELRL